MLLLATWQLSFCIVPLFCLMAAPVQKIFLQGNEVNEVLGSRKWQKCREAVRREGRREESEGQREEGNADFFSFVLSSCAYHCTRQKCASTKKMLGLVSLLWVTCSETDRVKKNWAQMGYCEDLDPGQFPVDKSEDLPLQCSELSCNKKLSFFLCFCFISSITLPP